MNIKKLIKEAFIAEKASTFKQLLSENPGYLETAINLEGHWHTPLHLAVLNGWDDNINWLLSQGVKPDVQGFEYIEELKGAVALGTWEKAEGAPAKYSPNSITSSRLSLP